MSRFFDWFKERAAEKSTYTGVAAAGYGVAEVATQIGAQVGAGASWPLIGFGLLSMFMRESGA